MVVKPGIWNTTPW